MSVYEYASMNDDVKNVFRYTCNNLQQHQVNISFDALQFN